MGNDIFINVALDTMLNKYESVLESKEEISPKHFLLYILKILAYIYGEENIIDSYASKDGRTFTYMLRKYNASSDLVNKFYEDYDEFYKIDFRNKALNIKEENPYFLYLQEDIINFYICKYKEVKFDIEKLDKFKNKLYTSSSSDIEIIEYNNKITTNTDYIEDYYDSILYGIKNDLELSLDRQSFLSEEVYELFNLPKEKREKLSSRELSKINTRILNHFRVSPIDPNINEKILNSVKKTKNSKIKVSDKKSKVLFYFMFAIIILIIIVITIFIGLKIVGVFKWIK